MKIKIEKPILILAIAGLVLRIGFILFVAKGYFGRENIYVDADTKGWYSSIEHLIKEGTYYVAVSPPPGVAVDEFGEPVEPYIAEYSQFSRMPGYSFFLGIFYLLCGMNWETALPLAGWFQAGLDFFIILLVFATAKRIFRRSAVSFLVATLYAFYPFIIVWTPVAYSEYTSVAIMIAFLYFFFAPDKNKFGWSGLILGVAVLFRPHFFFLVPAALLAMLVLLKWNKIFFRRAFLFSACFLLAYSPWPLRNYFLQKKIVFTQDLRAIRNWDIDVLAFMQYMFSVQSDWEPQFSQILHKEKVHWPAASYLNSEDSIKLERVAFLSSNCGSGFSCWHGYKGEVIWDEGCNAEIKKIYDELREEQMKKNPFNFWVKVPMANLQKAVLKVKLNDTSTLIRKIASLLFLYRTILLLIGMAGLYFMFRADGTDQSFAVMCAVFFVLVYFILCFGTSVQMRNIEMRYFLQPDIMMLFPAAFLFDKFFGKYFSRLSFLRNLKHGFD
ncbi:MAG TPA: hypothetical protein DCQ93_01055 [Bacteroidetes bacterium]|nr:hypothetical protein [Bacteroidota bacterium]